MAGLHVPLIPFEDVVGSAGTVPPAQMVSDEPNENVGVTLGATVTVKLTAGAQRPPVGVKV